MLGIADSWYESTFIGSYKGSISYL